MKRCCVPGCTKKFPKTVFFNLPEDLKHVKLNLKQKKQFKWLKQLYGLDLPENATKSVLICPKHFNSSWFLSTAFEKKRELIIKKRKKRLPKKSQISDDLPHKNVQDIIKNIPEVLMSFDAPDYISLDKLKYNEKKIELDLIEKYITNPICDANGFYNNDHDYLGLPLLPTKTESPRTEFNVDHSYSLTSHPACHHLDSRHFCNICGRNCKNVFSFNNHLMTHTMKNHVTCLICQQTFLTTTCLNNHLNSHTGFCEKCGNEVPKMQLGAHLMVNKRQKEKHGEIFRYRVQDREKVYFCITCMEGFGSEKEYSAHLFSHQKFKNVWKVKVNR